MGTLVNGCRFDCGGDRRYVDQLERLDHFECSGFVLEKMIGFQVGLVGVFAGIDFEDRDPGRVGGVDLDLCDPEFSLVLLCYGCRVDLREN